ncbi:hypothetical protein L2Y96_13755 [Luteibacter aegosomaticola]|uniref:hypothetical protein n=1 Tax=Luteibacter aegosomaticola TaxID=2911538 RepID=UPI001FF71EC8|nr:hypothetical protein [Luteibacter aegosomaticola]UPG88483.1 hypothetical protein L2Y96_13755 [Luteibacter aegosomaticola]
MSLSTTCSVEFLGSRDTSRISCVDGRIGFIAAVPRFSCLQWLAISLGLVIEDRVHAIPAFSPSPERFGAVLNPMLPNPLEHVRSRVMNVDRDGARIFSSEQDDELDNVLRRIRLAFLAYGKAPKVMKLAIAALLSALFALTACGEFRARPDLKGPTMTPPGDAHCVRGHNAITSGYLGVGGAPVTIVLDEPCVVPPPGGSP